MNNLLDETLDFLSGLTIHDGSLFIEETLSKWVDLLIDREGNIIPSRVDQYVASESVPYHWRYLPKAEICWRIIYIEFHIRMLNLQIDMSALREERKHVPVNLSSEDVATKADLLARYLNELPIVEAFDWLELLSKSWATTYDRSALRVQLAEMGYSLDDWVERRFLFFPIKLLADLTEA